MEKGYLYHIKDEYFERINDKTLMKNKENGHSRPMYYSIKDINNPEIFWLVPISSRIEKYTKLMNEKYQKYGYCNTIVIKGFSKEKKAFLIQNTFPITEKYIDHVHKIGNQTVKLNDRTQKEIDNKVNKVLSLSKRGVKCIFTDIKKIENILLKELEIDKKINLHREWLQSKGQAGEKMILENENLNGFKFYECDLRYAEIKNCELTNCVFYADMTNTTFMNNKIAGTKWLGSDITEMKTDMVTKTSISQTLENNRLHDVMAEKLKDKKKHKNKDKEYAR